MELVFSIYITTLVFNIVLYFIYNQAKFRKNSNKKYFKFCYAKFITSKLT